MAVKRSAVVKGRADNLEQFRGKHDGEPCIIMANGPSLRQCVPLFDKIECPVFGVNQSWTVYWPDYHIVQDKDHFRPPLVYKNRL